MASLREIQLEELSILEEIHKCCVNNNIKYALSCGSMLGAIRHKGFIPWDDDLDTYMSYSEFKKFEKCFKSESYFLQTEKTDHEMPFINYKVRKNNTLMIQEGMENLNMHQGIWVDIFVYYNAGKTEFVKKIQSKLFDLIVSIRCRKMNKENNQENSIQKVLNSMPESFALFIDKAIITTVRLLGSKKSNEYIMTVNNVYERRFYPKNAIDGQALYEFEGKQYMGLKAWNEYLTFEYGEDYMIPKRYDGHLQDFDEVII